jgi:hypothetical protein
MPPGTGPIDRRCGSPTSAQRAGRGGKSARRVATARGPSRLTCPSRSVSACTTNVLPKDDSVAALSVLCRGAGLKRGPF